MLKVAGLDWCYFSLQCDCVLQSNTAFLGGGVGICETFLTVTTIVALVGFSDDGLKIITLSLCESFTIQSRIQLTNF